MGQVNRVPKGLLDLLGVQSQGQNPPQSSDVVAPVVDVTSLYYGGTIGVHTENLIHAVPGNVLLTSIPAGETWVLLSAGYTGLFPLAAGFDRVQFFIQRSTRPSGAAPDQGSFGVSDLISVQANNLSAGYAVSPPQPFVLQSGIDLGFRILERDGGGNRTARVTYTFYRLNS